MRVDECRHKAQIGGMGRTTGKQENVYVDHGKYALLVQLAKQSRIPRAVLWREALDDILVKYGVLQETQPET
jgi:hypothetical protein